jgi:hypothetical protein
MQVVKVGSAGSTAGPMVTSSSLTTFPEFVEIGSGGAPTQVVSGTQSQSSALSSSLG